MPTHICLQFFSEWEKAQAAYGEVEEEVHQLHKQIMDIGGNKLKAAESKLHMVNNQIDTITGHVTKANVAAKTARRSVMSEMGRTW